MSAAAAVEVAAPELVETNAVDVSVLDDWEVDARDGSPCMDAPSMEDDMVVYGLRSYGFGRLWFVHVRGSWVVACCSVRSILM